MVVRAKDEIVDLTDFEGSLKLLGAATSAISLVSHEMTGVCSLLNIDFLNQ